MRDELYDEFEQFYGKNCVTYQIVAHEPATSSFREDFQAAMKQIQFNREQHSFRQTEFYKEIVKRSKDE
jgi:hypothetical protein